MLIFYALYTLLSSTNWNTELQLGSIVSALLGTIVGGCITAFITKRNLEIQFNNQTERELTKERKDEKIALNSILREFQWNKDQLFRSEVILNDYKTDEHKIKRPNEKHNLKKDKWEKHSDVVEMLDNLNFLIEIQSFYHNIATEINDNETLVRSRIVHAKEQSRNCIKQLQEYINTYYS